VNDSSSSERNPYCLTHKHLVLCVDLHQSLITCHDVLVFPFEESESIHLAWWVHSNSNSSVYCSMYCKSESGSGARPSEGLDEAIVKRVLGLMAATLGAQSSSSVGLSGHHRSVNHLPRLLGNQHRVLKGGLKIRELQRCEDRTVSTRVARKPLATAVVATATALLSPSTVNVILMVLTSYYLAIFGAVRSLCMMTWHLRMPPCRLHVSENACKLTFFYHHCTQMITMGRSFAVRSFIRPLWAFLPLALGYGLLLANSWTADTLSIMMPGSLEEGLKGRFPSPDII